ncbi:MAG TPA: DUF2461 domain-containing protein [Anaerolineae bacterium]|nr:DUF2461 domain-containing protein [Anaerolineae bacterium]
MAAIPRLKPALDFLLALRDNNNKSWFQAHHAEYEAARQSFEDFVDDFIQEFRSIEDFENLSAKDCVFRIYRDVRFSKDKSPYKPNMGASVALGGKHSLRAPYYLHIEPQGQSMLAGGIYMPTPDQLATIRRAIDRNPSGLKAAINNKSFKKHFGSLSGEKLKTPPRGYPADHPDIELLKYKHFIAGHNLSDKEVLSPRLMAQTIEVFAALKPLLDWLNDAVLPSRSDAR